MAGETGTERALLLLWPLWPFRPKLRPFWPLGICGAKSVVEADTEAELCNGSAGGPEFSVELDLDLARLPNE